MWKTKQQKQSSTTSSTATKEMKQQRSETMCNNSILSRIISIAKYTYSLGLLLFSLLIIHVAIMTNQTSGTSEWNIPPIVALLLFWCLLMWLGIMEGGQGALVGLQPLPQQTRQLYKNTHMWTYQNTSIVHNHGDNMERFIIGRQFLVVIVVFVINMVASPADSKNDTTAYEESSADYGKDEHDVWGFVPSILHSILFTSGLALILVTITLGQLTAQVNATKCMLDFCNSYFVNITIRISLLIEYSGLLHCVYLVQIFFSVLTGKPMLHSHTTFDDKEEDGDDEDVADHGEHKHDDDEEEGQAEQLPPQAQPHTNTTASLLWKKIFFWIRVLLSCTILLVAFYVTLYALFMGKTTMWEGVPSYISIVVFFLLMSFVGMMEGMQIATFAVVNMPEHVIRESPVAKANCDLVFRDTNFQAFLIGRQICVTVCQFMIARIITINVGDNENLLGVSDALQILLFDTGILGAIITTIGASLCWRIIAANFPLAFMSNPLITVILRICLVCEGTGICSSAFVLARGQKYILKFQTDEQYGIIGSSSDSTNNNNNVDEGEDGDNYFHDQADSDDGVVHNCDEEDGNNSDNNHLDLVFIEERGRTRSESFESIM